MSKQNKLFEAWVIDDKVCIAVSNDDEDMTRSDLLYAVESIKLNLMTGHLKFFKLESLNETHEDEST